MYCCKISELQHQQIRMKNKKLFYPILTSVLVTFLLQSCNQKKTEQANATPPNILFIAVDDLRPELGAYGASHIQSPNIDKFASQSLVFDKAYCNIPVCGASRASIMSGVRPGAHRFIDYKTHLNIDYPGVVSLPKHFKNNGYHTISNGKVYHHADDDADAWEEVWKPVSHLSPSWRDYLTEENIVRDTTAGTKGMPYEMVDVEDNAYFDGKIAEKTIADLKKLKEGGKPFFLAAGFLKPHLPFNAPQKYWDLYHPKNIKLPDNYYRPESTPSKAFHEFGELRNWYDSIPSKGLVPDKMAKKLIHGYYACVSYTDAQIGKVLNALEEIGLAENTIVVLWGDHGWNLGDHQMWCKHCNFASSLQVPLILKVPNKTNGQHTKAITEFIDIYPSLCDLAGLPIPEHTDGQSVVPLLESKSLTKDFAISKFFGGTTIVKDEMFYTEWMDKQDSVIARMLFDHSSDPLELDNLAEKKEYQQQVKELSAILHKEWGDDFFVDRRVSTK